MEHLSGASNPAIYLRPGAIERLTAPVGVVNLTRQQQAALLGVANTTFWRITNRAGNVSEKAIAEILVAAEQIAGRWHTERLGFDDLFEVRRAA